MLNLSVLTEHIIGAAIEVHRELGPGQLETAYEECLCYELYHRGLSYSRHVSLPLQYKSMQLDCGYHADLIVEDSVIVELKSVTSFAQVHAAELLTYLKITGLSVGLLLNFNVHRMKDGILRRVL